MKPYLKYLLTPLFFAPLAHAEMRHVDAHVHGVGKLELAQEKQELSATLTMPGMDIVGFETIKTHEQEEQVEKALEHLKQADLVMVFNSEAQCKLHHASARLSNDDESHDDHHSQKDHDDHERHHRNEESSKHHDEEKSHHHSEHHSDHDSEHHSDHDSDHHSGHHHDDHHDSDGHEDNHFDMIAHYEFDCKHPEKLTELKLELFKQYPASETVRVQALTEKGAFAKDLSAKKPMLKLSHGQH